MRVLVIILSIVGGLAILLVLGFVALVVIGMRQIGPIVDEGTIYANETIRAITTDWDGEEFLQRSSPEMLAILSVSDINQLMNAGRRELGSMTDFNDDAECMIASYELDESGESAFLSCTASAQFERAEGDLSLTVVRHDDVWQLAGFFVNAANIVQNRTRTATDLTSINTFQVSFGDRSIALENSLSPGLMHGASLSGATIYRDLRNTMSVDQILEAEPVN
ncbi:MAG: hypothetical protein MRY72_11500 [Aquisalinus sp.]|nr:hypothetical protein [Aquisalinus sp.]